MKTRLTRGDDFFNGTDGNDYIVYLAGNDEGDGGDGADRLIGGDGDDSLTGNRGPDVLIGGDGDDALFGGGRPDRLIGGAGTDTLGGGDGRDFVYGGAGADQIDDQADGNVETITYKAVTDSTPDAYDTISRFAIGEDRIDLRRIDADSTTPDDNDRFRFIGDAAFSGTPGELRVEAFPDPIFNGQYLLGDIDGDSVADFMIRISSVGGDIHIERTDLML